MSADLLRRAATVLRERAEAATGGDWFNDEAVSGDGAAVMVPAGRIAHVRYGDDATYIATMHPGVGLALADLLALAAPHEPVSHDYDECPRCRRADDPSCNLYRRALVAAQAILAEQS